MPFTYQYSQPDEYHFSLDSVEFAAKVADLLRGRSDLSEISVLDLCSGCGVIGFELTWHLPQLHHVEFVEVQEIYRSHFEKNVTLVNRPNVELIGNFINYDELLHPRWKARFDVIVSNPPYFAVGQGKLSPSDFKNRCRFFIDSTFENFVLSMLHCLAPSGVAYFLNRSLADHKINRESELAALVQGQAQCETLGEIRGTFLTRLSQKNDKSPS